MSSPRRNPHSTQLSFECDYVALLNRLHNRFSRTPQPQAAAPPPLKHRSTDPPHAPEVGLPSSRPFAPSTAARNLKNTHRQHHQRREPPNPAASVSRRMSQGKLWGNPWGLITQKTEQSRRVRSNADEQPPRPYYHEVYRSWLNAYILPRQFVLNPGFVIPTGGIAHFPTILM